MPGKVKVKILAGRNLPVMDRSSDTTDAYVEIKMGNTTYKTDVFRKSLNPVWDSEWYRFEVDDAELQDEPLQIRLMDYDTYSANDSIGKVYLDLNPLLLPPPPTVGKIAGGTDPPSSGSAPAGTVFSGWIPVFDTMHGIRGEVNIIVKVELFSDFNKFRQSSCAPVIPSGYHVQVVHGFVEELVVNDDPEYQWIDKIRTPRASNEARQTLFFKLSGELQRKIGLKALDLGGNSVIGYNQCFDLEGESGIVVRGIGTAVTLTKVQELNLPSSAQLDGTEEVCSTLWEAPSLRCGEPMLQDSSEPAEALFLLRQAAVADDHHLHERGSASPPALPPPPPPPPPPSRSLPPQPPPWPPPKCRHLPPSSALCRPYAAGRPTRTSASRLKLRAPLATPRTALNQESLDMMEYPFLTMTKYPPGFILHIGGLVNSRSVKLLERISNLEEPESRDAWWTELRMEVRSHARALACNVVLGYEETTSICDDVCVLSAAGTAAVVALGAAADPPAPGTGPGSTVGVGVDAAAFAAGRQAVAAAAAAAVAAMAAGTQPQPLFFKHNSLPNFPVLGLYIYFELFRLSWLTFNYLNSAYLVIYAFPHFLSKYSITLNMKFGHSSSVFFAFHV
ncbi:Putative ca2+-dependent phospholipid-binding protein, partial [Gryllus bimaculatus]